MSSLPIYSPCYCANCKEPLTAMRIVDEHSAWCPSCREVRETSAFQVESWAIGVAVLLLAHFNLCLI